MVTTWRNGAVCHLTVLRRAIWYRSTETCDEHQRMSVQFTRICRLDRKQSDVRYSSESRGGERERERVRYST